MDIPPEWEKIEVSDLSGVLMVIGAPDVGKSTFARYLFERLISDGKQAAFLDGDPGQSVLGPPTTMTLALAASGESRFPPQGKSWRRFVGSTSPVGHMLEMVTGAGRLVQAAQAAGAEAVVYDTSGLVDPNHGGRALKFAKIDLLQPGCVFAIQKNQELEPILQPLRRSHRSRLLVMGPSPAAISRNISTRRAHRSRQFARYFKNARLRELEWTRLAVYPALRFLLDRLIALEDEQGFTLGLGLVRDIDLENRRVDVLTPVTALDKVVSLWIGDVLVEPHTFHDHRIQY